MAPLWYANSLTHSLHSTLFPSLSLANQCHTPTQLAKGSATWSSHTVHTHISNWFYGLTPPCGYLRLFLVLTANCVCRLLVCSKLVCIVLQWLCDITSHLFQSRWAVAASGKHKSTHTFTTQHKHYLKASVHGNDSGVVPFLSAQCITLHLHYITLCYVMLHYVTLCYVAWSIFSLPRSVMMCPVATGNFVPFMGGCCMVIEHQLYLSMAEQMTCALARVYLWALDCVKSQRRVWSHWSHMQSLK